MRDAVAVLVEGEVPVADALAVAREMRAASRTGGVAGVSGGAGAGRVVETVRRSGKFGAQLKRLEAAGFSGFVLVRSEDGVIVGGEQRELGGAPGRLEAGPRAGRLAGPPDRRGLIAPAGGYPG